eukprot:c24594_g1_i3 orf=284-1036(+)
MAYSPRRGRQSLSPGYRSRSRSRPPIRRRRDDEEARNPGNNLYVTGLSTRVTRRDLEEHFSREGKVVECHLVVDPRTKESRGFAFVTMDSLEDADRSIKYLDRSILAGRVITVEKARRKRARTPTPGKYLGIRTTGRGSSYEYNRRRGYSDGESSRHSPRYSPYQSERDYSPQYSPYRSSRYREGRSPSPRYSPYESPRRRYRSPLYSPYRSPPRRYRSPAYSPYGSPDRRYRSRYRSGSRSRSSSYDYR